ncbi:methyl-CpG-binding domain protein 2 [Biomphalaria glabrata]|uniref:Methyl-CpG-binding domain protein 2-like n=1 Tax=Biomphalaria glabrata TaxID=6526 RepID=A0A0H3VB18_BIOGL|nr:methyl-CpG-binding domain protein 2-like [Biomphalaria glabrata]AJT59484.1 methyl-CpG-binding domain protein 2/3 [Biomphalaria glabrata]KAI8769757.1 methyl-CpG-binding domain protein 2-like [Biomphalaria glabrata]KAI8774453.1 methyl-CpG-binding domain protein 2 [Biomphalaria glabrata]
MALPPGWKREEVVRQSGLSAGKTDVYYFTPDGKKIRSKPQLARILGETFDLSAFDFRTGRTVYSACRKSKRQKGSSYDFARGVRHDASLVLPIRQTASIFKQPVTVVRNRTESKSKAELKHGIQEQPKQIFWEKRLQGLRACDSSEEVIPTMELPKQVQSVGPELSTENVLQSISAALHINTGPVVGQGATKQVIMKNPSINMDTQQPHIQQLMVSSDDIHRQEQRVQLARRRLQDLIQSLE